MILETERLYLRKMTLEDAPFIFQLVNDPSWLEYIGDKNVNSLKDAKQYIEEKILKQYEIYGFGFYLVITKNENISIGLTGFIKRPSMNEIEIGFAFLPIGTGKGYAFESTKAVLDYGKKALNLSKIVAITDPDNFNSQKLLERIGLKHNGIIQLPEFENPCTLFI